MYVKTDMLILSLGGASCVINLFNTELTDAFRTKQCLIVGLTKYHENQIRGFEAIDSPT